MSERDRKVQHVSLPPPRLNSHQTVGLTRIPQHLQGLGFRVHDFFKHSSLEQYPREQKLARNSVGTDEEPPHESLALRSVSSGRTVSYSHNVVTMVKTKAYDGPSEFGSMCCDYWKARRKTGGRNSSLSNCRLLKVGARIGVSRRPRTHIRTSKVSGDSLEFRTLNPKPSVNPTSLKFESL